MINTSLRNSTLRRFSSPPVKKAPQSKQQEALDTVEISRAKPTSSPGLGTLKKVGLGLALTAALGGAFLAGGHIMSQPEEVTLESQVEDLSRDFKRGFEDFKIELKRAGEDVEIGWNRGVEDAEYGRSREVEDQREVEDFGRQLKRDAQDAKRDIGRKANDFWRKLTD